MLSICSINLFGQTPPQIDSLVTIDIVTIRKANEKLIEANYLKETVSIQDSIISDYKLISEKQDSLAYKYQIKNITLEQELSSTRELNEKLNKLIATKNTAIVILGSVSAALVITTVASLFIQGYRNK